MVDGQNRDDEYFHHIGDPIEEEIIPILRQCFNDEIVLMKDLLATELSIVYVAYFPFHDSEGKVKTGCIMRKSENRFLIDLKNSLPY